MVASFNIPYPFVLGEPRSEKWNWEVPGETLLFHQPSAFQREAVVLRSSAARRLVNARSFARLAIGSTWGSLKLTTSLAPPGRSGCQINDASMPAPAKRTPGLSPRAGGTPRGAVSKCYMPRMDPLWKSSDTPKLEQTRDYLERTTLGSNYSVCSVCVLQTELGSSSSPGPWWAAAVWLEGLTSLCPHPQADKNSHSTIMEDRLETGLGDKLPTLWFHCYTTSVFSDRDLASYFFLIPAMGIPQLP